MNVCMTNIGNPTGGVSSAICTIRTMKMPNQTGSMPAWRTIGCTTAEVSTTIEIPSSAKPSARRAR